MQVKRFIGEIQNELTEDNDITFSDMLSQLEINQPSEPVVEIPKEERYIFISRRKT